MRPKAFRPSRPLRLELKARHANSAPRERNAGVSQLIRDHLYEDSGSNSQRGHGVAQIVEPHGPDPGLASNRRNSCLTTLCLSHSAPGPEDQVVRGGTVPFPLSLKV
jgi:hypothetical protein